MTKHIDKNEVLEISIREDSKTTSSQKHTEIVSSSQLFDEPVQGKEQYEYDKKSSRMKNTGPHNPFIMGFAVIDISNRETNETKSIPVNFDIPETAITMKYHPKVVDNEGEVIFPEEVSLFDIDSSTIDINPSDNTSKNISYGATSDEETNFLIKEHQEKIKAVVRDFALHKTEGIESFPTPSQFKGPSADTIPYKMLEENPEKLAEREAMSLQRQKSSASFMLDDLDIDDANLNIDNALSAMEKDMKNESINVVNNTFLDSENTQDVENDASFSPSSRP